MAIYLDYNATTPCDPRVVETLLPYFNTHFGNAASDNSYGWEAKAAVDNARRSISRLIGAKPEQIIFTSGATESLNIALKGLAFSANNRGGHIVTCKTEHKAVLETCKYLESKGYEVTYLGVDPDGNISLEELQDAIRPNTICIAMMYANNETGIIHPIIEIGRIARQKNIIFICDATQAVGKIPVSVNNAHIDILAFSAHKIYGPKGAGALYIASKKLDLKPLLHGGGHEGGYRSGTLNIPAIAGFGKASELALTELERERTRLLKLRDKLQSVLLRGMPGARINGGQNKLPHVINIMLPQIDSEKLLLSVSQRVAVSRGSACSANVQKPSHVLTAMGLTTEEASCSIRISLGRFTSDDEIEEAAGVLIDAVRKIYTTRELA